MMVSEGHGHRFGPAISFGRANGVKHDNSAAAHHHSVKNVAYLVRDFCGAEARCVTKKAKPANDQNI